MPTKRILGRLVLAVVGLLCATVLSSCSLTALTATAQSAPGSGSVASGQLRLIQEPNAGLSPIYAQLTSAKRWIDMVQYELTDPTVISDLIAARERGLSVRVLLNQAYTGRSVNQTAFDKLKAAGVNVAWTPKETIFHIKVIVIDRRLADVATGNLTPRYYSTSRDAFIIDTNPGQVAAIERTFTADFAAATAGAASSAMPAALCSSGAPYAGLVWSPCYGSSTARTALLNQIQAARKSIYFESEELADYRIVDALSAAARRGVKVAVLMTYSSQWASAFQQIVASGGTVRTYSPDASLYIHQKLILIDAGTPNQSVLIGSQNASSTSLTKNRELSLEIGNRQGRRIINALASTFRADASSANVFH